MELDALLLVPVPVELVLPEEPVELVGQAVVLAVGSELEWELGLERLGQELGQ